MTDTNEETSPLTPEEIAAINTAIMTMTKDEKDALKALLNQPQSVLNPFIRNIINPQ